MVFRGAGAAAGFWLLGRSTGGAEGPLEWLRILVVSAASFLAISCCHYGAGSPVVPILDPRNRAWMEAWG